MNKLLTNNRHATDVVRSTKFSGTCIATSAACLAMGKVPASLTPERYWGIALWLMLAFVGMVAIVTASALFAGWRPTLPKLAPAPPAAGVAAYAAGTRRYSSEVLRGVGAAAPVDEDDQHAAAVVDWASGYYRKA